MRTLSLPILLLFMFSSATSLAQDFVGYNTDNYAGIHGISLNPAVMADSRYRQDFSIIGDNFNFMNNYVGVKHDLMFNYDTTNNHLPWREFKQIYFLERWDADPDASVNQQDKFIYLSNTITGPGFMIDYDHVNSFAFTTKQRTIFMFDHASSAMSHFIWEELGANEDTSILVQEDHPGTATDFWEPYRFHEEDFGIFMNAWIEYGFSYARVVYNEGDHFVKVGGTLKLLQGLGAAYIYSEDLEYSWYDDDTLSLYNAEFNFGHSNNFDIPVGDNTTTIGDHYGYNFQANPTIGFDLGAVYEWRPDHETFTYDMDGETGLTRYDLNKYRAKLGVSILDIGRIKYEKGSYSGDFTANLDHWRVADYPFNGIGSIDQTVNPDSNYYGEIAAGTISYTSDNKGFFKMPLPTAISVQLDYNVWDNLYVAFNAYQAFKFRNRESKVRALSLYTLTPRWEQRGYGVGIPFSYTEARSINVGLYLRAGPVVIGTSDWTPLLIKENTFGLDAYFGLRLPIFQRKPKDRDLDGVSDKRDLCIDVPGVWDYLGCPDTDGDRLPDKDDACPIVWGPIENKGCPYLDKDGDGVLDNIDKCMDIPGSIENDGCPYGDLDKDGVVDASDNCIDVPGPVENNGCPYADLDKDGVVDAADNCIDVAGPKENNGCPYGDLDKDGVFDNEDDCISLAGPLENNGCPYADSDSDGVLDADDDCPLTPGVPELNGCPKLEEKEVEILRLAFENLEFETAKAIIRESSYASLNELAALLVNKPNYGLRIAGHTDNQGSDEYNLILSKDRAEAVKTYLMNKGVSSTKLVTEYYGETKPIETNDTDEGRQKNRRVEMTVIFE